MGLGSQVQEWFPVRSVPPGGGPPRPVSRRTAPGPGISGAPPPEQNPWLKCYLEVLTQSGRSQFHLVGGSPGLSPCLSPSGMLMPQVPSPEQECYLGELG